MTYMRKEDTLPYRAMQLALRPQGVTHLDFPTEGKDGLRRAMARLLERNRCTRKDIDKLPTYFATQDQWRDYQATGKGGHPPKNNVFGAIASKKQNAKVSEKSRAFTITKIRATAEWDADTPAHYPVDAKGRPLYKITVAPKQPQPTKTNTHSGAY
jgi:hypothetical protein